MRNEGTTLLTESALAAALAVVLSFVAVRLPINVAGGTIGFAMLPILVVSLRRGVLTGMATGLVFGLADYLVEPYFVHPAQLILDYPVAFALCGLAGLFAPALRRQSGDGDPITRSALIIAGVMVGVAGRFAAHFASGMIFFAANAPEGQSAAAYSLSYNLVYLFPSFVLCMVAALAVVPALARAVPLGSGSEVDRISE